MGRLNNFCLLLAVIFLAAILRLWNLGNNPPGLTWDEAALGYNAYSILETGKDEYGNFLPLNLKSFGDYKPALYAYLSIPFVAILGLNEWAVRLPSAFFGVATVVVVYFMVWRLFKNRWFALLASLFLAISPFHIQFSRPAFEANLSLFLNSLGVLFFIKGIEKRNFLIFSGLAFGLSLFAYQASRLFVPILVGILWLIYHRQIKANISVIITAIIFALFIAAFIFTTFLIGGSSRLSTQNFFAYQRSEELTNQISDEDGLEVGSLSFNILHGQWWEYVKGLTERYLIYFSPKMLFIDGDYSERHKVPDLGVVYYFSIVLIPLGLVYFIRRKNENSIKLLFVWLLLAPIPAVLSRDLISILRAINMCLPLAILEGAGLLFLLERIKSYKKKLLLYLGITVLFLTLTFNFLIYLDRYFVHAPKEYSKSWLYGYKQIYKELENLGGNYERVLISDELGQPYIYYLFFNKYPPKKFQEQAILDQPTVDVGTVRKIDNFEFRHIYWPEDRGLDKTLFVGTLEELPDKDILPFPDRYQILKEVKFLNGELAFRIVETK